MRRSRLVNSLERAALATYPFVSLSHHLVHVLLLVQSQFPLFVCDSFAQFVKRKLEQPKSNRILAAFVPFTPATLPTTKQAVHLC